MKAAPWIGSILTFSLVACATSGPQGALSNSVATLSGGFHPDPYSIKVIPGGPGIAADIAGDCAGYIDRLRPSLKVNLSAAGPRLGILVAGASDTTLVVNDPQGTWHCNDDSEYLSELNPGIAIDNPASGIYDIWVGSFEEDYRGPAVSVVLTETDPSAWAALQIGSNAMFADTATTRAVNTGERIEFDGIDFGDDGGNFANDDECDDPRFRGVGSASTLEDADRFRDATDCSTLYRLGRIELASSPRQPATTIALGSIHSGRLANGKVERLGFEGVAGSQVYIDLSSSAFDTILALTTPGGERLENDDFHGSTERSRLTLRLPESGEYLVDVAAYDSEGGGNYTLAIDTLVTVNEQRHVGELSQESERLGKGEYFDSWTFEGVAGQVVDIVLRSENFDTFLVLETPDGQLELNDDDPEGDSSSRIERELSVAGTYTVRATSFAAGETGAYELSIVQSRPGSARQ